MSRPPQRLGFRSRPTRRDNQQTARRHECAGAVFPCHRSDGEVMSKRTFQPNRRRRAKVHGFRLRMRTRAGRSIVASRRRKGREKLTA